MPRWMNCAAVTRRDCLRLGLGTLLGWWLDKKLATGPWLLVVGALFGIGVGFYLFFKILTNIGKGTR